MNKDSETEITINYIIIFTAPIDKYTYIYINTMTYWSSLFWPAYDQLVTPNMCVNITFHCR